MKLLLDYSDGRYTTRPLDAAEAAKLEADGFDIAHVEDRVYDAYLRHCEQEGIWQALWRSISNEQYIRRREKELLPLEDANREIERLKSDLSRAERTSRFFEDEWLRATGRQTSDDHASVVTKEPTLRYDSHTCIFPQPGCDVDALEYDEWRVAAAEILKKYNVKLGEEGSRYQGCCCGHTHRLLSPAVAAKLREAGFLVENDVEDEEGA